MKAEQLEQNIFNAILEFDKLQKGTIYLPRHIEPLFTTIRDYIYALEEDGLKEEFANFAVEALQFYLQKLKEEERITDEVFKESWNDTTQTLFMYMGDTNVVADINKTISRFLTYIDSGYQGQDPRTTCAPEEMLKMFDMCIKIIRFLGDKSTEGVLKDRMKTFAFQDTMESANNGNRNAKKYNITIELLERIGSPEKYVMLDETQKGGVPYETNEFGDLVAYQGSVSNNKGTQEGEEHKAGKRRPHKLGK